MNKTVISTASAPKAIGPYSQAIGAGNLLFVSGQIPVDIATGELGTGITQQTELVLKNLQAILAKAGGSLENVVKTTVFLADMNDFAAMNTVYARFFTGDYPARSTVQIVKLPKDALVEIECIAVL